MRSQFENMMFHNMEKIETCHGIVLTSLTRRQNHNGKVVHRSWLCFFLHKLALNQVFPTFIRSRTTWVPRIVNAYHFFQNN